VTGHGMTVYVHCMTMLSFRVEDEDATAIQHWADELGVDRSALLREAVRLHLNRLASEREAERWEALPLTEGESALAAIDDWGPAEGWEDWADARDSTR
jgi:predicted transcriptional regulator